MIGGYLANPATNYPSVFGGIAFFIKFPYALPCIVGAMFPLAGTLAGFLFLEEVLLLFWASSLSHRPAQLTVDQPSQSLPARHHASEAFLSRTSTTIPVYVPTPAPSGTSTPIPQSQTEAESLKPPPISDLWTAPVIRVLVVYVCTSTLHFPH